MLVIVLVNAVGRVLFLQSTQGVQKNTELAGR